MPLPSEQMQPPTDQRTVPSVQPQGNVVQPPHSNPSSKPTTKPDVAQPAPARPYNLDKLISDRAKAEADLDSMMSEMRGQMKGR